MYFDLFQSSNEFPYPDKICGQCLSNLKIAFDFKHRCEIAFEQLMKLSDVNTKFNVKSTEHESTLETKPIDKIDTLNSAIDYLEYNFVETLVKLVNIHAIHELYSKYFSDF